MEMMRSAGHGAVFKLAVSGEKLSLVGFAFADDSDIAHTAAEATQLDYEVLQDAQ